MRSHKSAISTKLKRQVWNQYIGSTIYAAECYLGCGRIIRQDSFHGGHVIAEANGGTLDIANLRPICGQCNHEMGTKHMFDFIRDHKYVPNILTEWDYNEFNGHMSEVIDPFQCTGTNRNGSQCRHRRTSPDNGLCWVHQNQMDCS